MFPQLHRCLERHLVDSADVNLSHDITQVIDGRVVLLAVGSVRRAAAADEDCDVDARRRKRTS